MTTMRIPASPKSRDSGTAKSTVSPVINIDRLTVTFNNFTDEEKKAILELFPIQKDGTRTYLFDDHSFLVVGEEGKPFLVYSGTRAIFWENCIPAVIFYAKYGKEAQSDAELLQGLKDIAASAYIPTDMRLQWYETFKHYLQYKASWGTFYYSLLNSPKSLLLDLNLEDIAIRFGLRREVRMLENGQITKLHGTVDGDKLRKVEALYRFMKKQKHLRPTDTVGLDSDQKGNEDGIDR